MHTVDPYYEYASLSSRHAATGGSSDDLLRVSVDTAATKSSSPARSPSPLFRPFTRVGWHHPVPKTVIAGDPGSSSSERRARTSSGHKGSLSLGMGTGSTGTSRGGGPPQLTLEEFEALPLAIQRKYFSTLERFRFVQGSGHVDGIFQHYTAITAQNASHHRRTTITATVPPVTLHTGANSPTPAAPSTRRRASRSVSDNFASRLRKRSMRDLPSAAVAANDSAFYASLPDKIKKRAFTPEEQVLLSGQQGRHYGRPRPHPLHLATARPDITLDTPTSSTFSVFSDTDLDANESLDVTTAMPTTTTTATTTMAVVQPRTRPTPLAAAAWKRTSGVPDSFYDSFRCLEDGDGLDLRLFVDDYHANLRDSARPLASPSSTSPLSASPSSPTTKERRPSTAFRRHLSISKMAFHSSGSNSSSSARPVTTAMPSSGRSSPLEFSSSSLSPRMATAAVAVPAAATPQVTSHAGSPSSSSLVLSSSMSSLSPAPSAPTIASASAVPSSPPLPPPSSMTHTRRKSRAMSLITPSSSGSSSKHAAHGSLSSAAAAMIDPAAAHYQDPEARAKLRVYLASPQKFDEAIQFGFPATATASSTALPLSPTLPIEKGSRKRTTSLSITSSPAMAPTPGSPALPTLSPLRQTTTRPSWDEKKATSLSSTKTNNNDDDDSDKIDSDQASTPADSASPKTPNLVEVTTPAVQYTAESASGNRKNGTLRTAKPAATRPHRIAAASDDSTSTQQTSREMTLRMTLTRLDLRAAEDQIYGWQQTQHHHGHHHLGHSYQHSRKLSLGGGGIVALGGGGGVSVINNGNNSGAGTRKMAGISSSSSSFAASSSTQATAAAHPGDGVSATAASVTSMPSTPRVTYIGASSSSTKESIEQVFAGIDQWGDLETQEKGVMKRFWNRVRRA